MDGCSRRARAAAGSRNRIACPVSTMTVQSRIGRGHVDAIASPVRSGGGTSILPG